MLKVDGEKNTCYAIDAMRLQEALFLLVLSSTTVQTKPETEKLVAPYHMLFPNNTCAETSSEEPRILVTRDWANKHGIKRDTSNIIYTSPVLKVGCFHFPPFTFKTELQDGTFDYSGVEVSLVTEIAYSLGLKPEFHSPNDGKAWGTVYENGTIDGLFGDIVKGVVDVGMAEYFYYPDRIAISHPSEFYFMEQFCFTRKKPAPVPRWQAVYRPFQMGAWAAVYLSLLVTVFYLVLNKYYKGSLTMPWSEMVLSSLAFFIGQSLDWKNERYF